MTIDELADTRARFLVEGMEPVLIHYWATDALAAGFDTPALRRTAEADMRDQDTLHRYFDLALDELGAPRVDDEAARWQYARYMSRSVVDGHLDGTRAARRIVWGAAEPLRRPEQLQQFVDVVHQADQPGADAEAVEAACRRLAHDYLGS